MATGADGIFGQLLLLCDGSVILPIQIIFTNILPTSINPDMWALANVASIFKKDNKRLVKNYRPISPVCGKILEKIIFNNLYIYLHTSRRFHNEPTIIFLMKSIRLLIALNPLKLEQYF